MKDRGTFWLSCIENFIKAKETGGFEVYGYCLMDNHVHMLLKEDEEIGTSKHQTYYGRICWLA